MRRVRIEDLTPSMRLGKSLYHFNSLLLAAGTDNLNRYISNFKNLGIPFVYVDDGISEDIEIQDAITQETRSKCKITLQNTIRSISSQGNVDVGELSETVEILLQDILKSEDILVSLNDIGTTDDSTLVHSVNTTVFSLMIANKLNFTKLKLKKLAEGALLHDIGKTLIRPEILYKKDRLTDEEYNYIKKHTVVGYAALKKNVHFTELTRLIALQHHERNDSSGYPYGLVGNEIHLFSRIVAIADMYDALTAERCYRSSLSNYEAYKILMEDAGEKVDRELLTIFLKNIAIYPNGMTVKLSNGERGIVKSQNPSMPFRPIIRIIDDRNGEPVKFYDLDLMKELNVTILNT